MTKWEPDEAKATAEQIREAFEVLTDAEETAGAADMRPLRNVRTD